MTFRRRHAAASILVAAAVVPAAAHAAPQPPPGAAYELVTPGANAGVPLGVANGSPATSFAATDGDTLLYQATKSTGITDRGPTFFAAAARGVSGWSSTKASDGPDADVDVTFGHSVQLNALPAPDRRGVAFFAPTSYGAPNPVPQTSADVYGPTQGLYAFRPSQPRVWVNQPRGGAADPAPGAFPAGNFSFPFGWSADSSALTFGVFGRLGLGDDAARKPRGWGMYTMRDGTVTRADRLPNGALDRDGAVPAAGTPTGGGVPNADALADRWPAVRSSDGSRFAFLSPPPDSAAPDGGGDGRPPQLYVGTVDGASVLASRTTAGATAPGGVQVDPTGLGATALMASDGTAVVFASVNRLTAGAPAGSASKLYRFDVATRTVTLLAAPADGVRAIYGVTHDAAGVLYATGDPGSVVLRGWSAAGSKRLGDLPNDFALPLLAAPAGDAESFAFYSTAPLDGAVGHVDGVRQLYRYGNGADQATCVSCAAASSSGVESPPEANAGNRVGARRIISDDGSRMLFETRDPLTSGDVNGALDVYRWTEAAGLQRLSTGTDGSDTYLLDAGGSGRDVFIGTRQALDDTDVDGDYDIYDVREGGGFPRVAPPVACEGDACQPPGAAALPAPAQPEIGPVTQGPAGARPKTLRIVSTRRSAVAVVLRLQLPAAGTVSVTGGAVRDVRRRVRRASTAAVTVRLTRAARRAVRRKGRVTVRLRARFVPTNGPAQVRRASLTIKRATR